MVEQGAGGAGWPEKVGRTSCAPKTSVRLEEGLQEKTAGQVYLQRGTFNQQDLGQTWRLQQGQASWKEGAGEIWKTVLE